VKKRLIAICILALAGPFAGAQADVSVTANGGAVTEYIFRGVPQTDGKAAAQGGVDVEASGFYAGTWFSTVETGLEYDLYGGYVFDVEEFSFGVGGTGYFYTDDFDDDYLEVNLSASWRFITIDYAIGEYDASPSELDYDFLSVTVEYDGFYALFGAWGDDFDGDYFEIGYGNTLTVGDRALFDYTFAIIRSDDKLSLNVDSNGNPDDETFFYAGAVKTFDLFSQ
jgi:hypothetical protein